MALCVCDVCARLPLLNLRRTVADPALQVFTSITPAWNNENLNRLSTKLESGVIFAHVRAAYPGMPVSEQNCHPFQWGERRLRWAVAGWLRVCGVLEVQRWCWGWVVVGKALGALPHVQP